MRRLLFIVILALFAFTAFAHNRSLSTIKRMGKTPSESVLTVRIGSNSGCIKAGYDLHQGERIRINGYVHHHKIMLKNGVVFPVQRAFIKYRRW